MADPANSIKPGLLDYPTLAERFYQATLGQVGTDEMEVYRVGLLVQRKVLEGLPQDSLPEEVRAALATGREQFEAALFQAVRRHGEDPKAYYASRGDTSCSLTDSLLTEEMTSRELTLANLLHGSLCNNVVEPTSQEILLNLAFSTVSIGGFVLGMWLALTFPPLFLVGVLGGNVAFASAPGREIYLHSNVAQAIGQLESEGLAPKIPKITADKASDTVSDFAKPPAFSESPAP